MFEGNFKLCVLKINIYDFSEIIIISQPKSCTVKFGGDALFHCEAKCNAPLQYKWFKDGKPMEGMLLYLP